MKHFSHAEGLRKQRSDDRDEENKRKVGRVVYEVFHGKMKERRFGTCSTHRRDDRGVKILFENFRKRSYRLGRNCVDKRG